MTSEATAKLISASGIAATALAPFASTAPEGDAMALRDGIASLERLPALAELARETLLALNAGIGGTHAKDFERCLADLRAGATALLRHLHASDALQHVGSRHAVWVKLVTRLPLGEFADGILRIHRALDSLTTLPQVGGTATLEAADIGPLWLKVGLGNQLARELLTSLARSAETIIKEQIETYSRGRSRERADHACISRGESEARRIAILHLGITTTPAEIRRIEEIMVELAGLLKSGIEIHPTAPSA